MIIFGWRTRITQHSDEDILQGACPECQHDLELNNLKSWFTLYFIPIFPYNHIDTLYSCKECEASYRQDAREALLSSAENGQQIMEETKKMFIITLVSCMTHMAKIDGKIDLAEQQEIDDLIAEHDEYKEDLDAAVNKIRKSKDNDEVFAILRRASEVLTAEAIMTLIGRVTKVLLADGKIDEKEENLLKEYLLVCGMSPKLYKEIIKAAKKAK